MRFSARLFCFVLLACITVGLISTHFAFADSYLYSPTVGTPNPQTDQHAWVQSVMLDVTSAVICQLIGVDPMTANHQCYGSQNGNTPSALQVGGIVGLSTSSIGMLYTKPAATNQYVGYLADNFGLGDHAYAAIVTNGGTNTTFPTVPTQVTGFSALTPVLQLWNFTKNLAYLLLTLIFLIIGLGVMLRVKLDPRTVISLQNQIPKVIIGILLITFSYAIVGLLVDFMWATTYVGINLLGGQSSDPQTVQRATDNLYSNPLSYVSSIFVDNTKSQPGSDVPGAGSAVGVVNNITTNGLVNLAVNVSSYLGDIASTSIDGLLPDGGGCSVTNLRISGCVHDVVYFFTQILALLIVGVALFIVLVRIWFMLIKAYAYVIIDTIVAPLWIILGFVPGSTFTFSSWFRHIVAHLAVFPATIMLILLAKLLLEINTAVKAGDQGFLPPLIGNLSLANSGSNAVNFGSLLAIGVLFLIPELVTMLKDALKVKSKPYLGNAVKTGFSGGLPGLMPVRGALTAGFSRGDPSKGLPSGGIGNALASTDAYTGSVPLLGRVPGVNGAARGVSKAYIATRIPKVFNALWRPRN